MQVPAEDPIPTRYSLLSRLQDWGDDASWKDFFDTYWRLIYAVASRAGLTDTEAQEVVQETVISVARDLPKFKRDRSLGSFKGWLRNIVRWRIADQLQKRNLTQPGRAGLVEVSQEELEAVPDPAGGNQEALWEQEWQSNLWEAATERVKRQVKEEQYQIFHLYVLKQWPALKVARTLGVSIGQVYIAKHRVSSLIKKELKFLEQKHF